MGSDSDYLSVVVLIENLKASRAQFLQQTYSAVNSSS
jgi:hypothetical protein